ncbi:uncharacterized protein HMPREF1541_09819 [Cyphellophora europaea CBS 101466]|uniref:Uncharacterized protein n=1 Tax=Cyphellophora europaea (strain CBS 101466) TaxID=1220924 RepID=W2SAM3_CYPE1|nr:uncharacterized protein HMPREF1541_09819 [Cyphellophora europaea CBS 101466]ETN44944.1 hypothetical protein HMPREF1541_09819 [Cyphellophora europaea CBS 101466]
MNVGQYLKRPVDFSKFSALRTLELQNIAVWCRYHDEDELCGPGGDGIMLNLAMFNIRRHSANLAALCASADRSFNVLLCCRFVVSSVNHGTLDAVIDIDKQKVLSTRRGSVIKDRNAWAGFY